MVLDPLVQIAQRRQQRQQQDLELLQSAASTVDSGTDTDTDEDLDSHPNPWDPSDPSLDFLGPERLAKRAQIYQMLMRTNQ